MIAQSNAKMNKEGKLMDEFVRARIRGDFPVVHPTDVNYMDVAPNQILSVAAALIPFLEHDDANRALMGSNMQRQSVPLMMPHAPIVGTGLEAKVAKDSRTAVVSPVSGVVDYVDAERILIRSSEVPDELALTEHTNIVEIPLRKYQRTNQNTCKINAPLYA